MQGRDISSDERRFVLDGVLEDIRGDGRSALQYRQVSVENETLPHVNGSSRVVIGDSTTVLCSVRAEISAPSSSSGQGRLEVGVDFSPGCARGMDDRNASDLAVTVAHILQLVYVESWSVRLDELKVVDGRFCWVLHVDLLVVRMDGDIIDACSLAMYAALTSTRLPKIQLLMGEAGVYDDFEVVGDCAEATTLPLNNLPICITAFKIGTRFVLDCSADEAACSSCGVVIAVDRSGDCCGVHKLLGGEITIEEVLMVLDVGVGISSSMFASLDKHLVDTSDTRFPDRPPARLGLLA